MTESETKAPAQQQANPPSADENFDPVEFLRDLDGGAFIEKLAHSLKDVAAGVINHPKNPTGTVKLTFKIKKAKEDSDLMQLAIDHTVDKTRPTRRGSRKEDDTTSSLMYTTTRGAMSIFQPGSSGSLNLGRSRQNDSE